MLQCVAVCCSALQCVTVRYSVLQRVAACCSVLQRLVVGFVRQFVVPSPETLQHAATHRNTPQRTAYKYICIYINLPPPHTHTPHTRIYTPIFAPFHPQTSSDALWCGGSFLLSLFLLSFYRSSSWKLCLLLGAKSLFLVAQSLLLGAQSLLLGAQSLFLGAQSLFFLGVPYECLRQLQSRWLE